MANFNPFRPAYLADPYPILEALRAKEPGHWNAPIDAWIVTSYADCLRILQDDDNFSSDPTAVPSAFGGEVARKRDEAPLGHTTIMGNSDPPEHTRLRAVLQRRSNFLMSVRTCRWSRMSWRSAVSRLG